MAPLSKTQYGLYVECVRNAGEACYNIPYCYVLDGSLDEGRLCQAVEAAVAAHPTLFTRIELNHEGEPQQVIDSGETFLLRVEQVGNIEAEKAKFVQPFNIMGDKLFRIRLLKNNGHYYLLQDIHHIVCDGASRKVLLEDIEKAYYAETLPAEELTLGEVATREAEAHLLPAFEEARKWYAEHFDCGECYSPLLPDLEGAEPKEGKQTRTMAIATAKVEAWCKEHAIYKSTLFTAAYGYLLAKFNNEQEVLFTTIHNGRSDKRLSRTMAMLVKTLPVYAKFTDDTTVLDFLLASQEQMTGCRQYDAYAYSDVVTDLGLQAATSFAWHGTLFESREFCGKPMTAIRLNNNTREVPVYFKAYIHDGHYCIEAEYNAHQYSETLISTFLESYEAVVEGFLSQEYLRDISIMNEAQAQLLDSFNETDDPYDDTQTIVSLFRQQAIACPDKTAVVFKEHTYTYKEVDELSNRIASRVSQIVSCQSPDSKEPVVAILIPRCEWMAIASLGVLKAGCAFQPLDPSYPKERLNFMVQDIDARLLIADEELLPVMDEYNGDVLLTKDFKQLPPSSDTQQPSPETLFTLIYTSGSTGVPKGGMSEHRNWVAFCHMHQKNLHITRESRVGAYASFGFDASPMEIFGALTIGAELHIIPEELRLDLIALNDYFERNGITHTFMTTQVAYQFATGIDNHSLRFLLTGGEKLPPLTPPKHFTMVNGYGPSETICYVTSYFVTDQRLNIPIGKAMTNCKLYIVDKFGHRLPVGANGELWVAGPQVGRGYLNRPEKTAEVFIPNPFNSDVRYHRIYKTGDIVRYLSDGNIDFVGRRDGQVKIRGFRVELKEVEAVIHEFPRIKDVTVQAYDADGGGKYIAAYLVSDTEIDTEALSSFILDQKPPYMVPEAYMRLDALPMTPNGKINRKALPVPELRRHTEYTAPEGETEKLFCDIFSKVLKIERVGAKDNFFEIGGTSINAIKVIVEAGKHGVQIVFNDLFDQKTARGLAALKEKVKVDREQTAVADPVDRTSEVNSPLSNHYSQLLKANTLDAFLHGERQHLGDVLLTGATGYLGMHILNELLTAYDSHILCPLRVKAGEDPMHRLKTIFFYYFGNKEALQLLADRVTAFAAEVTQPDALAHLSPHTSQQSPLTVVNCVANVKHFSAGNDIEMVNIESVRHLITFCLRTGARLIHVSTISIAGLSVDGIPGPDVRLSEQDLWLGQNIDVNKYVYSKYKAEELVLDAIAHHGLNAKIMRVGNLSARQKDGEFQINFQTNNFLSRLRAYAVIGMVPYEDLERRYEFSPIDEVARAIMLLATTPKACVVFHPYNVHRQFLADILNGFASAGIVLQRVEKDVFQQALGKMMDNPDLVTLLRPLMAYNLSSSHDMRWIESVNSYTTQVLYRFGFQWPPTARGYIRRFVDTIAGFDYFSA